MSTSAHSQPGSDQSGPTGGANWTICQIGSRENYAVARALARRGRLEQLVSDVWIPMGSAAARVQRRLRQRSHPEIEAERVWAPTGRALMRELADRMRRRHGWTQIMRRNAWFQREALRALKALPGDAPRTVFAYSYAAADIFDYARTRGWRTVLGQIDPGPVEARLVAGLYRDASDLSHEPIPDAYWDAWRRETELADRIVVNSDWSKMCLAREVVSLEKIDVVPLAYEPIAGFDERCNGDQLTGPRKGCFTERRPLRLLFLGQVTRRKGIDLVFEAVRQLADAPLRLDVVGPVQLEIPEWVAADPRIFVHGGVVQSEVMDFYKSADLFLFPTRSDGFGLTQLEALSAGVPVIASNCCGAVVQSGVNGEILEPLEAGALAECLQTLMAAPATLAAWRSAARLDLGFGIDALSERLVAVETRLAQAA